MKTIFSTLLILLALMTDAVAVADEAGSVIFAKGDVSAERQPPLALTKGDTIFHDDEIVTGASSRAQLLMIDGAKIAIRPDSRLRLEEYAYTPAGTGGTVSANDDKTVMSLVKGGFRTITGAIGKEADDEYEVRTAVGVLGIRGTDYTAVFCNGDCTWVPGVAAGSQIADGLYLGVTDGTIVFRTSTRTIELTAGEYAFIPLDNPEPQRLDSAPEVLLDENDLRFDDSQGNTPGKPESGSDTTGFNSTLGTRRAPDSSAPGQDDSSGKTGADDGDSGEAPPRPTIGIDADGTPIDLTPGETPQPQRGPSTIAYGGGPIGGAAVPLANTDDDDPSQVPIDANGDLLGFEAAFTTRAGGADNAVFAIGSAANVNTGSEVLTVMRWGRWSGGAASVTTATNGTTQVDLGAESIHWIQSAEGTPPFMPISGVANYTLIGGTSPTDNLGNGGILGNATFQADFVSQIVDSTLSIDINGSAWNASGTGTIGAQLGLSPHLFLGLYNNVDVDGIGGGSGEFAGFFSDPGPTSDPSFPGGVGLSYSLTDAQGASTVSGTAAFGNP